ncbi:MAG TPA: TSUP family transporter, partial [Burkholderiales bacterium]
LLLNLQPRTYALAMGAALVAYGLTMLLRRPLSIRSGHRPAADALVGALGGITGPLAAFPGACVTIWCGMRGWDKVAQRAVYQPYILIMQIVSLGALYLLQRQSAPDPALVAYALPGLAGAVIGLRVFRAATDLQFQRMINLALVASGIALVFK